ncbi:hypothetical protein, partial [Flavobacterium sp.]|uniref:hypothetical protein n=1 Tax=Flavobacterium sp. TaxID=239 RepID=UPI0025EB2108
MINKKSITEEEPNLEDKVNGATETIAVIKPVTRTRTRTAKPALNAEVKSEAILDEPIVVSKGKVAAMKDSDKEKSKKE